jgi:hypothetical protein
MTNAVPPVHRRNFVKLSIGAFVGAVASSEALAADLPAWQQAVTRRAEWMKNVADGCWHCGAKNLAAVVHALQGALGPAAKVAAGSDRLLFSHNGQQVALHLHYTE